MLEFVNSLLSFSIKEDKESLHRKADTGKMSCRIETPGFDRLNTLILHCSVKILIYLCYVCVGTAHSNIS